MSDGDVTLCQYCDSPSELTVEIRSMRKVVKAGRLVEFRPALSIRVCRSCKRDRYPRSPERNAAKADAERRYWGNRQTGLF